MSSAKRSRWKRFLNNQPRGVRDPPSGFFLGSCLILSSELDDPEDEDPDEELEDGVAGRGRCGEFNTGGGGTSIGGCVIDSGLGLGPLTLGGDVGAWYVDEFQ